MPLDPAYEAAYNAQEREHAYQLFIDLKHMDMQTVESLKSSGYDNGGRAQTKDEMMMAHLRFALKQADKRAAEHLRKAPK